LTKARTADGVEYRTRPISTADAERERDFIRRLSPESRHSRFMHAMSEPSAELVQRLVDVDGRRAQALVAVVGEGEAEQIIGVARYCADDTGPDCEFAVAVSDEWQCRGIGTTLTQRLFEAARQAGFRSVYGTMLGDNARMLDLAEHLGLKVDPADDKQPTVRASRLLGQSAAFQPRRDR
jgi:GNAT superfamily N-acetyltransferase